MYVFLCMHWLADIGDTMSSDCGIEAGHQRLAEALLAVPVNDDGTDIGCIGAGGIVDVGAAALELPAEGGGLLLYGEPGLELEAGGDLLPDLLDCTFDLGLATSFPFCCCLVFARLFLNHN